MPPPGMWGGRGSGGGGGISGRWEEEVCHLQWLFPHVIHWEVGGSGRTIEKVRDWVAGVHAFGALWGGLCSYVVPIIVPHGRRETRAELGKSGAVGPGETPLRGRDRRQADPQQPVWEEGGDGSGNSVQVYPPEGLTVGVGLRDAINEVGGDRWSKARSGERDGGRWGGTGSKAWTDGHEQGVQRLPDGDGRWKPSWGSYAKGWVFNGLQGEDSSGGGVGEPDWGSVGEDGFN